MAINQVLDTNVVLYHFGNRLIHPLQSNSFVISVITEIELLSYPQLDPATESKVRVFLSQVPIANLTRPIREAAIQLRKDHRLRIPDAIIAATAQVLGAELLTNDLKLLRIHSIRSQGVQIR